MVDSDALITDKDGNMLDSTDIKNDSKVIVTFTIDADGTNKAQYIKATE